MKIIEIKDNISKVYFNGNIYNRFEFRNNQELEWLSSFGFYTKFSETLEKEYQKLLREEKLKRILYEIYG